MSEVYTTSNGTKSIDLTSGSTLILSDGALTLVDNEGFTTRLTVEETRILKGMLVSFQSEQLASIASTSYSKTKLKYKGQK